MNKGLMICALLLCMCAGAAAQDIRAEFEKSLSDKSVTMESISCDFSQVRSMSVLASDVSKDGKFTYLRPGNILLAFDDGDYIMLTDSKFCMKNAGAVTNMKVGSNPMLKELRKILSACMTGDVEAMASGFEMAVEDAGDCYDVSLEPLKGRGAAHMKRIRMSFLKDDMSLESLVFEEASGDSTRYEFRNKRFNVPVAEGTFE